MNTKELEIVRPDMKGRIALGVLAKGISSFVVEQQEDKIVLIPYAEIPAREKWLFDNKEALSKVKQGLKDSAIGKVHGMGSLNNNF